MIREDAIAALGALRDKFNELATAVPQNTYSGESSDLRRLSEYTGQALELLKRNNYGGARSQMESATYSMKWRLDSLKSDLGRFRRYSDEWSAAEKKWEELQKLDTSLKQVRNWVKKAEADSNFGKGAQDPKALLELAKKLQSQDATTDTASLGDILEMVAHNMQRQQERIDALEKKLNAYDQPLEKAQLPRPSINN